MTPKPKPSTIDKLTSLGFSQYEAKVYVGLLSSDAQTGYSLSKFTSVPQPKVYETLRRLVDRGAAAQISDKPARFNAVPSDELLSALEADFSSRVDEARDDLRELQPDQLAEAPLTGSQMTDLDNVFHRAARLIEETETKLYLSGKSDDLARLEAALLEAFGHGVELTMLHFGPQPFSVPHGTAVPHLSTTGHIYRHHQARHLAVVSDSEAAIWGLADDGVGWRGMYVEDPLFAAALKAYIRHDIYLQRIFGDLGEDLRALYGPGLEGLTDLSRTEFAGRGDALADDTASREAPAGEAAAG